MENITLRLNKARRSIDCNGLRKSLKDIDKERNSSESPVSNNEESVKEISYGITNITITNKTTLRKHEESVTRQSDNIYNEISESELASTKSSCENEIRKNSSRSSKTSSSAQRNKPTLKKNKIKRIEDLCTQKISMFDAYVSKSIEINKNIEICSNLLAVSNFL